MTETLVDEVVGSTALRMRFADPDGRLDLSRIGFPQHVECGDGDYVGVFVVGEARSAQVLVPRFRRKTHLRLRLGEKVIARFGVDSLVFPSSSELDFGSEAQARSFLAWCRRNRPRMALFFPDLFTDTHLSAAVASASQQGYLLASSVPTKHLLHRFGRDYESFFESKRSKYKNQLRKNEKLLSDRTGGKASLMEYRSAEEVSTFLDAAATINQRTYQYRLFGETIRNDAQTREKFEASARMGHFRSFVLWYENIPLCFVLGEQRTDGVYRHMMTGFDPDWRDCAPGINCNAMLLRRLYAKDTPRYLDFGCGDAEYKRLFSTETRSSISPILLPKTPRNMVLHTLLRSMDRLNGAIVNFLAKTGFKDRVKRFLRMRASG